MILKCQLASNQKLKRKEVEGDHLKKANAMKETKKIKC